MHVCYQEVLVRKPAYFCKNEAGINWENLEILGWKVLNVFFFFSKVNAEKIENKGKTSEEILDEASEWKNFSAAFESLGLGGL